MKRFNKGDRVRLLNSRLSRFHPDNYYASEKTKEIFRDHKYGIILGVDHEDDTALVAFYNDREERLGEFWVSVKFSNKKITTIQCIEVEHYEPYHIEDIMRDLSKLEEKYGTEST